MKRFHSVVLLTLFMTAAGLSINPQGLFQSRGKSQLVAEASLRWGFWNRRTKRLTTRSTNFCEISPGLIKSLTVWNDRPLFKWQGNAVKINVRDHETGELIWSQPLDGKVQEVVYNNQAKLEPGKIYQWQVLGTVPNASDENFWTTFQIMPDVQRKEVDRKLKELKAQYSSQEALVMAQVEYFEREGLWSDILKVLSSADRVSTAFVDDRDNYMKDLCNKQGNTAAVTSAKPK